METGLLFVTSNQGKVDEIVAALGIRVRTISLQIHEIQSLDLVEIARHKARDAYTQINEPLIVDDTGLAIHAWEGFPGPFIKHIVDAGGPDLLLRMMRGQKNRHATFTTVIGYYDGLKFHHVRGETHGVIARAKQGKKSWGINEIFIPDGHTQTYAQMSLETKNEVSHRGKAVRAFAKSMMKNRSLSRQEKTK